MNYVIVEIVLNQFKLLDWSRFGEPRGNKLLAVCLNYVSVDVSTTFDKQKIAKAHWICVRVCGREST